jgi:hypothetical protein
LIDHTRRQLYSTVNSLGQEIRIPVTAGIAGNVATTGEPVIIHDAYSDARFNKKVDVKTGFKTRNIMCVPLKVRGGIIGVVQLVNKTEEGVLEINGANTGIRGDSFTMDDLRFLQVFASQAALAITNSGALDDPEPQPTTVTASEDEEPIKKIQYPASRFFPAPFDEAGVLLDQAFDEWQFDAMALSEVTDNRPLSSLGRYLFDRLKLVEHFGLDREKVGAFFVEIELGYDDAIPYHNREHAASVMHAMHALLRRGGLSRAAAVAFEGLASSTELGRMACLLAAAIHDYQHRGLSNDFLVKIGDARAMRYNDQHVNEHHHVAAAFALLLQPKFNFLSCLSSDAFVKLRRLVIDLVLGTDMADSSRIIQSLSEALDRTTPGQYEPATAKDATVLLQVTMKCADLGHMALDWRSHVRWVKRVEEEFFAQGDQERALGLPISFLMDRYKPGPSQTQVGFFDNVVLPLFRTFMRAAPSAQPMLMGVMANYQGWRHADESGSIAEVFESCVAPAAAGVSSSCCSSCDTADWKAGISSEPLTDYSHQESSARQQKRSGRARQRAAKYWSKVRCRTPSPDDRLFLLGSR